MRARTKKALIAGFASPSLPLIYSALYKRSQAKACTWPAILSYNSYCYYYHTLSWKEEAEELVLLLNPNTVARRQPLVTGEQL